MKRALIIWISTCIVIGIGLIPYKFPTTFDGKPGSTEILVSHAECTCCADFQILKGSLKIPQRLENQLKNPIQEIYVTGENTPFNKVNQGNFVMLLYNNEFVLSGTIIDVSNKCGTKTPVFKVNKWSPTHYHPILWTFNSFYFCLYFMISALLLIIASYFTLKRK